MEIIYRTILELTFRYYRVMGKITDWMNNQYGEKAPMNSFQKWIDRRL